MAEEKGRNRKYLQTIDGETLMNSPLMSVRFVVESLFPPGLHILAGAPKVGKSWLALWLCLQVAKGEQVWNFRTEKSTALYLCLEDSKERIQNRLFDITEDASPDVYFTVSSNSIGHGLEEQLENFIKEHPDTLLIVIDTLQKVRLVSNDNAYANDYRDLGILKSLADRFVICLLVIHHLRKTGDHDPMNRISGTTGLSGAADGTYVLLPDEQKQGHAILHCRGRDIESRELQLKFDLETYVWQLVADSVEEPEQFLSNISLLLKDFLKEHRHFCGTPTELAELLQPLTTERILPASLSKKLLMNQSELMNLGINYNSRRSNGKRLIELYMVSDSAISDGSDGYQYL